MHLTRFRALYLRQELPGLAWFLTKVGLPVCPSDVMTATEELAAWNQAMYQKTAARLRHKPDVHSGQLALDHKKAGASGDTFEWGRPEDEPTVMQCLWTAMERETTARRADAVLSDKLFWQPARTAQSELYDHIIAGQETSAIALTYLSWQLARHPGHRTR